MSFESLSKSGSRRRITFLEIDLPLCLNTYGVAPCTAALAPGLIKCFNTRNVTNDCQDPANFNAGVKTYRFLEPQAELPTNLSGFPCLDGWSTSPTEIDPDGGLGLRSEFNASLTDFNHHDRGIDPYIAERDYNAIELGTFFGKFKARNPFYWGHPARIVTGYLEEDGTYDPANFETRHYVVTNISNPDSSGSIKISGRDPIKRADDDRAKFPAPSTGKIDADIDENATTVTLTPAGVGNSEYPASGKAKLGKEIVTYTRSNDVCTIVRGDNGVIEDHREGSTFQAVGIFTEQSAPDIVYELMTNYATIDAAFLDKVQWDAEADEWIPFVYSAEIATPTGVNQLVKELAKQAGFYIWWDDREQQAVMQALRSTPPDAEILSDEDHLVADSFSCEDREERRISEAWVFHGLIDPAADIEDPSNYEALQVEIVGDNPYETPKVDITYGRWIPRSSVATARSIGERRVNRFKNTPRMMGFSLDAKDYDTWTGSIRRLSHRNLQDATGARDLVPVQVLSVTDSGNNTFQYKALEYRVAPLDNLRELIIDTDVSDYNVRDAYETEYGALSDEAIEVRVIIEATANVTGITGGGLPAGSHVHCDIYGNWTGYCGNGGNGSLARGIWEGSGDGFWTNFATDGGAGEDGGDALVMTEDWTIRRFGTAVFAAGAGGGGGGAGKASDGAYYAGGGGGGAQYIDGTSAGTGGNATIIAGDGITVDGVDGTAGNAAGPGNGGAGGDGNNGGKGGAYGKAGTKGGDGYVVENPQSPATILSGGPGGAKGRLAVTNGFTLTIAEGNNPTYVIGDIV